jgi:hypothetical protein
LARIETLIKDVLMAEPSMTAIVDDRGLDREYRLDGWSNAPVDVVIDGVFQTTLVVTTEEGVHPLRSPINARRTIVTVWAFGNTSQNGYNEVQAVLDLSNAILCGDPDIQVIPGVDIVWNGLIGPYRADDGCVGRYDYGVSGIPLLGV